MKKKITKQLVLMLVLVAVMLANAGSASAFTLIENSDLPVDTKLTDQSQRQYAFPQKIMITRVSTSASGLEIESERWISMLHYYYITRLGFADLPYNYIIDKKGDVFEGRENGDGVIPELANPEGVIMIGYLSNHSDVPLAASNSLDELITDLSYKYGIPREKVQIVETSLAEKKAENEVAKLEYEESNGSVFGIEMDTVLAGVSYSSEDHLDFKAELVKVDNVSTVDMGDKMAVKVTIKNSGEEPWFTFNDFLYIKTADGEDSPFAVNGEWDSFDTPVHLEGKTVLPGESVDVEFNMGAVVLPDNYEQKFVISRINDKVLAGTDFTVSFAVTAGDAQIIEIKDTGEGYLNVRDTPSQSGNKIAQVTVGKRYITTEYHPTGWYKIKYSGDQEGWVYALYVKNL